MARKCIRAQVIQSASRRCGSEKNQQTKSTLKAPTVPTCGRYVTYCCNMAYRSRYVTYCCNMSYRSRYVTYCCNILYIVAICYIAVDMLHIVAICHIAVNMSNRNKICPYKMKKNVLDKRRPIPRPWFVICLSCTCLLF